MSFILCIKYNRGCCAILVYKESLIVIYIIDVKGCFVLDLIWLKQ